MKKVLPNARRLCSGGMGQNYWFNGCMDFLMECLGEDRAYDYWFFSGVTGDSFTQIYSKDPRISTLCLTDRLLADGIGRAFDACGYTYDWITGICAGNRLDYFHRICQNIDQGLPVIVKAKITGNFDSYGVICGYDGDCLYYLFGEDATPQIYPERYFELLFIGERKHRPSLPQAYRQAVLSIPRWITREETTDFSFGRQAFADWAASLQDGRFRIFPDDDPIWYTHSGSFSCWSMHGNYLCMLGTNGCAEDFLQRALHWNPDMTWLEGLLPLFRKHNGVGFHALIGLENGFYLYPRILKDMGRMKPVCEKIRETGAVLDEILALFEENGHTA